MNPRTVTVVREKIRIGNKMETIENTVTSCPIHRAEDVREYAVGGRAETVDGTTGAETVVERVPTREEYLRAFEAAGRGKAAAECVERAVSHTTRCLTRVALRFEGRGMPRRVARAYVKAARFPLGAAYSAGVLAKLLWHVHHHNHRDASHRDALDAYTARLWAEGGRARPLTVGAVLEP
jgi:hypothetical protein